MRQMNKIEIVKKFIPPNENYLFEEITGLLP